MDNKENILECALHLFFKRGYDTVGVQEIAEVSGVTKPTLYYYFKSVLNLQKFYEAVIFEPAFIGEKSESSILQQCKIYLKYLSFRYFAFQSQYDLML